MLHSVRQLGGTLLHTLCVMAAVVCMAGLGSVSVQGTTALQPPASLDTDSTGTLDFFDVAHKLELNDSEPAIALYLVAIERDAHHTIAPPEERRALGGFGSSVCALRTGSDDDHDADTASARAHCPRACAVLLFCNAERYRGDTSGARRVRGPPSVA